MDSGEEPAPRLRLESLGESGLDPRRFLEPEPLRLDNDGDFRLGDLRLGGERERRDLLELVE